ncbi:MAG: acyl-CoA/acyl-ACP dehydrogenase [Bdellovibrio sp.]|nr:acyl-CoA/acyl-ACP dehydrogenase [Bdellovibrio sp.]
MSYFRDSQEWQWLFNHAFDWEGVLPVYYPSYPTPEGWSDPHEVQTFYKEMLEQICKWSEEKIAPRAPLLDKHGPGEIVSGLMIPNELLKNLYHEAKQLELYGLTTARHYGGLELPVALNFMAFAFIGRACLASSSQLGFYSGIADMLERFCAPEDCQRLIPKILNGELSGCMALTEPEAGSDIGSLQTTAILQPDGSYQIRGNKMFITNAGGGLSFVLARIQGEPEGLGGISLFLIEQFVNGKQNYLVTKDEHKLGMRGSFTCEVMFDNSIAKLVGDKNHGLTMMFHLMNQSRVGVGGQGLGIMEACLDYVKKYAQERKQFGRPLMELPLFKRNFDQWQVECDAFRALYIDSLNYFTLYHRLDLKKRHTGELCEREQKIFEEASQRTRQLTPLLKYYGAESALEISKKSIQALGGHGLMLDHSVERWHRDSFGPVVYEGTSQIQALMVLKDLVKDVFKRPADFLSFLLPGPLPVPTKSGAEHGQREFLKLDAQVKKGLSTLILKTLRPEEFFKLFDSKNWMQKEKLEKLMMHSESICQAMSYLATMKVLAKHYDKEESRGKLFWDYHRLIHPRLMGILDDWKIW